MKYALITGASRGIGKSTALELSKAGYNLILTCKNNLEQLDEVAATARANSAKVITFAGDIGKPEICTELFSIIAEKDIAPEVIINNAGISYVGLLQDMTFEEWNNCVNTNLSSVFYICKLAVPKMLSKHKGKIINISSIWGEVGASCEVAYSATKGGINAFTKALAKELAPSNIQVNSVAFGAIDTDMNNHLSKEDKDLLIGEIPSGRMGTPDEAAKMILSIINSPDYLTGQVIVMDGAFI